MGNHGPFSFSERTRLKHEKLMGQRRGRLTIQSVERRERNVGGASWYALCLCDCGKEHVVAIHNLKMVSSCGCYRDDSKAKRQGERGVDVGDRSERLVVVELVQGRTKSTGKSVRMVYCHCDCGGSTTIKEDNFLTGHVKSCGCLRRELAKTRSRTHGMYGQEHYHLWQAVKDRVTKESPNYKGRGIGMHKEWFDDFLLFYEYMVTNLGSKPTVQHSLDRIDVNRGYEPGNIRWASPAEQARNRTTNHLITANGETLCVSDWAERLGVTSSAIYNRLKMGWDSARAVTTPAGKK